METGEFNSVTPDVGDAGPIHAKIKALLKSHAIRPNEHLAIRVLAEICSASTTRVREALIRLAVEGLIAHYPNDGFYTRPLVVKELADAYEMAFVLFKYSIETNVSGFDISDLNKPIDIAFDREGRIINVTSEFTRSHVMFLEALYRHLAELSGNAAILKAIRNFNVSSNYVRELDLSEPGQVREIAQDIMELIGFLQARRVPEAVDNMRKQLEKKMLRLPELVKEANARDLLARPLGRH